MELNELRTLLVGEAKSSPNLLSDLAGLEKYIAESYNNRSFIELLQNADDAKSTKFKILNRNNCLFVANNGNIFSSYDLESLCRSASSNKVRGNSIGYRGIGFKSVVGFANEIHLISGELEITFSKARTSLEVPLALQVPLVRIPHILNQEDKTKFASVINEFKLEGYTTIFIFSGTIAQNIELEFASFDSSSLLFLRNIIEAELQGRNSNKTIIEKTKDSNQMSIVNITSNGSTSSWRISSNEETAIGFNVEGTTIKKLEYNNSLVYSFLPTEDHSGLGVIINGDFSTDPSRKHIIFDKTTLTTIKSCVAHIQAILAQKLRMFSESNLEVVNALIPYIDPRILQFKKPSFEKYLLEELSTSDNTIFSNLYVSPKWLNYKDYSQIATHYSVFHISHQYFNLDGFYAFAKFLGAKEDSLNNFKDYINNSQISILGCVQISIQIFRGILSKILQVDNSISQLKVLMSNNIRVSLDELNEVQNIDLTYLSLIIENGLSEFEINQALSGFMSIDKRTTLFSEFSKTNSKDQIVPKNLSGEVWLANSSTSNYPAAKSNVYKWRSAEENAMEILNVNGFKLVDVSKQNLGYDYDGIDPDGNEIQIEVKSITMIGQSFKLTNNEIAVAQDKKDKYYLAIVRQLDSYIEIALIQNPTENLVFDRQCAQWVWECSRYDYKPTKFEI